MMPFMLGVLPVPATMLPLAGLIVGALAALYVPGLKLPNRLVVSVGWPKKLQRTPAYTVRCGVSLKSSCAKASCCQAHRLGVMSVDGVVKVATLPSRKLAKACWKAPVPAGPPALEKLKLPRSEEHTSELQSLRHLVCR